MLANCDRIWQIKVPIFYLCLRIAQFRLKLEVTVSLVGTLVLYYVKTYLIKYAKKRTRNYGN